MIGSTAVVDGSGGNAFAGSSSSSTWSFSTGSTPVDNFANWISNSVFGLAPSDQDLFDDPDGDGIGNGVENFFGTNPGTFSQGLVAGSRSSNSFNLTHPQGATASDLATFRLGGWTTVNFTTEANTPSPGITRVTAACLSMSG